MKKVILIIGVFATALTFSSCKKEINGSGHYVTQNRTVNEFEEVESSGDFNVILVQNEVPHIELYGEDNILAEIRTDVSGDRLRIYFDHSNYHYDFNQLTITVYSPSFTEVDLQGSGKISNADTLFHDMDVTLSGSGQIDLVMDNSRVHTQILGSGKINLNGYSTIAKHTITGSGNIHAFDLQSYDVTAAILGSGNCKVNASDYLNVTISGSGSVFYLGNPEIHTSISGSGSVLPE